jgi:NDP-sugar pyrophosphorylase family protein
METLELTIHNRTVRALILAAGEGTRLRPLTLDRPKPMVPIAGRPLLAYIVEWTRDAGICDVAINLNYKAEVITDYFGDGSGHGVSITYSHEEKLLGSAGAARRLRAWVGDHPLLVAYGDVLTDLNLRTFAAQHQANLDRFPNLGATLSLYRVPNPTEVGLVGLDETGRITRFLEKPGPEQVFTDIANAGVCIIEPSILDDIIPDTNVDFGLHVFPALLAGGRPMCGMLIPEDTYLLDIGSPAKYAQANDEWPKRTTHATRTV